MAKAAAKVAAEWVAIERLVPWDQNPRKNDRAVPAIMGSIKRFGFGAPIVARKADGRVIAGHTRLKAAQELGLKEVPVRYLDISESEATSLSLADNKLGEIADWDDEALAKILADLRDEEVTLDGLGWSDDDLEDLINCAIPEGSTVDDGRVPKVMEVVHSEPGCVYHLGPHRLVCGDSTDEASWIALMGDEKARMVWTDPPYGVSYIGKTGDALTVENDDLAPDALRVLLVSVLGRALSACRPGAGWYVAAPAGPLHGVFASVLVDFGVLRQTLTWLKDRFVLGRSDYHYRHEPIFYGWVPGGAHYFVDDRTQDSVLECPRPTASVDHPTMKPVALVARCIENSSKPGWLVLDPFGGSGTTLLAAAQSGRVARLIELSPAYCDVIRRRWTRWAIENGRDPGPGMLGDSEDEGG